MTHYGTNIRGAKHWRERAENARTTADQMLNGPAKATLYDLATKYEILARAAAECEARMPLKPTTPTADRAKPSPGYTSTFGQESPGGGRVATRVFPFLAAIIRHAAFGIRLR
jgi:hypothetical protein